MIIDYYWDTDQEIKEQLSIIIAHDKIVPVIGSGFTRNCIALKGRVPSGTDMSEYLAKFAAKEYGKDESHYRKASFPELCTYYSKRSTKEERFSYFSSYFTNVKLSPEQMAFLRLFSKYVYTLNIDDAIENNCKEYHVVLPRWEFSDEYINTFSTVFKVHGDVHHYLTYIESEELIFNKRQYVDSIKSNRKILSKLKDDFSESNVLYIGCSLTEEPDLMSIVTEAVKTRRSECQVYYVTDAPLDADKKDLLEDYGITACIIVKDYPAFYSEISSLCSNKQTVADAIEVYKEPQIIELSKEETTIKYLLNSNSMIPVPFDGIIYKPYFLLQRKVSEIVLGALKNASPIHIIYGHRISGKSSCLVDIFEMIKDKTRYFFPSGTKVSKEVLSDLFKKINSVFFFDTNCLEAEQIFDITKKRELFSEKNNYVIIAINSSDRHSLDLISENHFYRSTGVKNIISSSELGSLNKSLQNSNLPTFISKEQVRLLHKNRRINIYHTILDNLCMIAEKFSDVDKSFDLPDLSQLSTPKELSLLILLATQQSLSSYDQFYFDLRDETILLVEKFPTHFSINYFESNLSRLDSNMKVLTNSRYYLLKYLGQYAKNQSNYQSILTAYKYIYEQIFAAETEFDVPRKMLDFIKFDVLNDVFYRNNRSVIDIIKYVYEGLEDVMNVNPQFKHQRAKSIFWLCPDTHDEIAQAAKYVDLAKHDIENILKSRYNEKLKISLEHVKYTQASIYGRLCALEEHKDRTIVIKSIQYYDEALSSYENFEERKALKEKKTEKRIYHDLASLVKHILSCDYDADTIKIAAALAEDLSFDDLIL